MKKTVPTLITIIAILIFICGWLLAQVIHLGFHAGSVADELTLLGVLATLVGAILAGAGIIVALVAISTMWNVDERLTRASSALRDEIISEIREETNQYFLGFERRLQALNLSDLKVAEEFMRQAIELYPNQMAARSSMAFRLFEEVQKWFALTMHLVTGLGQLQSWSFANMGRFSDEALRHLAAEWLDLALQHGDDPDGAVSLCRSELYGILGNVDKMKQCLRSAITSGVLASSYYSVTYYDIAPLLLGVRDVNSLQEMGSILLQQFPMSKESVLDYTRSHVGRMGAHTGEFLALLKPGVPIAPLPSHLCILSVDYGNSGFRIQWPSNAPAQGTVLPSLEEPEASEDEIWKLIDERFWVITPCADDPN